MKIHARVVVIGGGVTGCAIIYHLVKMGIRDAVLLERSELTSGSTWHAAGNLFSLARPSNAQRLQVYTINLYRQLEQEIGHEIGYHATGGMHLAATQDEVTTLAVSRARSRRNGVETEWIGLDEARRLAPILNTANLKAVLWEPIKGHVDPSSVTNAFASLARQGGATVQRHSRVTATTQLSDGSWDVMTPEGTIHADIIVNAAGLWAREVAQLAGIRLPLMPVEHHYLVTEPIPEIEAMDHELPTIGESEAGYYSRQEGMGILLGAYENRCHHWSVDGTPANFGHELLSNDLDRMERNFEIACNRMPALARAGIKSIVNGPMIFSPDLGPLIGPHPELRNYFCACGVMSGFNQSAGIGRTIAEWIVDGEPSLDVSFWDVARFGKWAGRNFTIERTGYYYANRQERPFPHLECAAGRPVRTFPAYESQKALGAVFGFNNGWEQPLWYARAGEEARDGYSYSRPNWWSTVGQEVRNVRQNVGVFEISTFAKYLVTGPNAEAWLKWLLAGKVPAVDGKIALCPMLLPSGRILGDLTVVRLSGDRFMMFGAGTMQDQHLRWFGQHRIDGAAIDNLSDQWSGLMIAGPNARQLLARLTHADVAGAALPFLSAQEFEVKGASQALVLRVSFSGELGYEIYTPMMYQRGLYAAIVEQGTDLGLAPAGTRALTSLRIEKAFPSWGSEVAPDYSPMTPGLARFVDWERDGFVGRDAALLARAAPLAERFVTFVVDAQDADCSGGEPVFKDGHYVGYVTSGAYGYCVNESLALGFVQTAAFHADAPVEIEINGTRCAARMVLGARFDPAGARMRC